MEKTNRKDYLTNEKQFQISYDQIKLVDYDLFCVVISGMWINPQL